MLLYFLKFTISIALFYLFYQLVLRRLTFYGLNRLYLFGYTALSFFIPFINVSPWIKETEAISATVPEINQLTFDQATIAETTDPGILLWVIGSGMFVLFIRWLFQYLSLQQVKQNASRSFHGEVTFYDVDNAINPFSFGRGIYFNSRLHNEEELKKIIQHEFVHVKQHHTADLLLAEILCIFNWYNPFAWMLRKAIRENLEFLADEHVLKNGVPVKDYQYLLLKVTGGRDYSIANQLHFSSLKKRIVMMNKLKSARVHLVRFIFVLPVICLLLLAFRQGIKTVPGHAEMPGSLQHIIVQDTLPPVPPPPLPPAAPPAPANASAKAVDQSAVAETPAVPLKNKMPAGVSSINIRNNKATVKLKNGRTERFDLNNASEKALFEDKYGVVPAPPENRPKPPASPKPVAEAGEIAAAPAMVAEGSKPAAVPVATDMAVVATATAPVIDVKAVRAEARPGVSVKAKVAPAKAVSPSEVKVANEAVPVVPAEKVEKDKEKPEKEKVKPAKEKVKPAKASEKKSNSGNEMWPSGLSWAPVKDNC